MFTHKKLWHWPLWQEGDWITRCLWPVRHLSGWRRIMWNTHTLTVTDTMFFTGSVHYLHKHGCGKETSPTLSGQSCSQQLHDNNLPLWKNRPFCNTIGPWCLDVQTISPCQFHPVSTVKQAMGLKQPLHNEILVDHCRAVGDQTREHPTRWHQWWVTWGQLTAADWASGPSWLAVLVSVLA